ncbi:MAG: pilus assembly protein PilM [Opitutales bacterium]|nr:pilus assembly protein PilM [Opitutales bacterium]MCH8539727.1 pilus assembly protein PilM [Opitutales bacterium]
MFSLFQSLAFKRSNPVLVAGVEFGPREIRIVLVAHQSNQSFKVLQCHYEPLNPGLEMGSHGVTEGLSKAIKSLRHPPSQITFWSTLARGNARIYPLTLPPVKLVHLPEASYWAIQREDPFDEKKNFCDVDPEKIIEVDGRNLQKAIGLLVEKNEKDRIVKAFSQAGPSVEGLTLAIFAIRNLFREGWLTYPGKVKAIAHFGWNYSRIMIFDNEKTILVRAVPIGLEQIAEDLVKQLSPSPDSGTARSLILDLGISPWPHHNYDEQEVKEIVNPPLERLSRQLDRTLEYTRTKFPDIEAPNSIHLTGHFVESPHCLRYLKDQTTYPIEIIDPFPERKLPENVEHQKPLQSAGFATALGLALAKTNTGPNLCNPLSERLAQISHQKINVRIFVLFLFMTLLLGFFYLQQHLALQELRDKKNALERTIPSFTLSGEEVLTRVTSLHREIDNVRQSLDPFKPLAFLHEIFTLAPPEISIHHVHQIREPSGQNAPSIRIEGSVSGEEALQANRLGLYHQDLQESVLTAEATLRHSNLVTDEKENPLLRFSMEIKTIPLTP